MPRWSSGKDSCIAKGLDSIPGRGTKLPTGREVWPKGSFLSFFFFQKEIFIPVRSNDLQAQWRSRGTEKVRHSQVWDLGQYVRVYACVCICTCAYTHSVTAHQAPQSMGFFRQEYWSRMPFCPSSFPPGEIVSPALAVRFFTIELPGKPQYLGQVTAFSKRFHMCEMKVKSKY